MVQVRFLGGGKPAMASCYPTCDTKSPMFLCCERKDSGQHLLFCQQYPTGTCVAGNGGVRSSRHNVASSKEGDQSVSGDRDCQQQGGREPGSSGMGQPR